jgi:hypothetical protein
MRKALHNHPILAWAIGALLLHVLLNVGGVQYDDGRFGLLVITDGIWGWMYWLPSELLFVVNAGRAVHYHIAISVVCGLLIAVAIDKVIRHGRSWRREQP